MGESTRCKTVSAMVSYTHSDGMTYMLVIHFLGYLDVDAVQYARSLKISITSAKNTPEDFDTYVGVQVNLPIVGKLRSATIRRLARSSKRQMIWIHNENSILDTRSYDVEFPDGWESAFTANSIAESMYAQCDMDVNQQLLFKAIVGHKSNYHADKKEDRLIVVNGSLHHLKITAA